MWHGIHSILSWIGVLFISGWLVEVGTFIFVWDMFLLVDLLVGILILLHKISINVGGQCIWERPNSSEIDFNRTRNIKSASTKFVLGSINLLYLLIVIIKLHGLKCMTNSSWWTGPSQYLLYILNTIENNASLFRLSQIRALFFCPLPRLVILKY